MASCRGTNPQSPEVCLRLPKEIKSKQNRHPCRSCTSSFDVSVEQQLSSEHERQTDIHLNPKGQTKCDSWSSSKPRKTPKKKAHSRSPGHGRHEQIQRRA